ncbi:hypothetical protein [Deinococcus sp.]|uniref:hypothetical protein n=1 Tax=Deinococcus sp. TaxID=47478 RepID=UPI0025ECD803|nr:hypothetical protein [Deinococcus sp.]
MTSLSACAPKVQGEVMDTGAVAGVSVYATLKSSGPLHNGDNPVSISVVNGTARRLDLAYSKCDSFGYTIVQGTSEAVFTSPGPDLVCPTVPDDQFSIAPGSRQRIGSASIRIPQLPRGKYVVASTLRVGTERQPLMLPINTFRFEIR